MSDILTPKETAEYLKLHIVTLYRMLKEKKIPSSKIGGQWRFSKQKLEKWIENKAIVKVKS